MPVDLSKFISESKSWSAGKVSFKKKKDEDDDISQLLKDSKDEVRDYNKKQAKKRGGTPFSIKTKQGFYKELPADLLKEFTAEDAQNLVMQTPGGGVKTPTKEEFLRTQFEYTEPTTERGRIKRAYEAETPKEINRAKDYLKRREKEMLQRGLYMFPGWTKSLSADIMSLAARLVGNEKTADHMSRYGEAVRAAAAELDVEKKNIVPPAIRRALRGAQESLALMYIGGKGSQYRAIATAAANEANQAWTEGKDSGLKGKELIEYATGQGIIEGGPAYLFSRFGLGGLEKVIGRNGVGIGSATIAKLFKRMGITTLQELPEEIPTELGHNLTRAIYGIEPDAMSGKKVAQTVADTALQTLMSVGMAESLSGVGIAASAQMTKEQKSIIEVADSGKTPSRSQWRSWGFDPKEGKSAKQRKEGVQQAAEAIRQEAVQATEETAVVQEAPVVQEATENVAAAPEMPTVEGTPEAMPFVRGQSEEITAPTTEVTAQEQTGMWEYDGPAVNSKGEVAEFIKGPEGHIGISLNALSKGVSFAKHAGQRFFTARGELPTDVFKEKVKKDGQIARLQRQLALELSDYKRAVKSEFGKKKLTIQERAALNSALKGEVPLESLPKKVGTEIGIQRNNIDALSRKAIEIGAISGKLEGVVTDNDGMYVHRSYRKHDNPKWAEQVPVEIRNRAEAHLRQEYPEKSEPEIQGLIEKLLYEGSADESPIAFLKNAGLGSKDARILMKRGDFAKPIRDLMGEYNDVEVNYAKSMTYLGNLIANHQFLGKVRELGMGTFFNDAPIVNDYGELKTRIAADESSSMSPLNGLYTTPEIKAAFDRASGKGAEKPAWLRWAMTTNAVVKMNKTVGSLMTHVRNFNAGPLFALMQGHWHVGSLHKAYKSTMTDVLKKNDAEWRAYTLRLIELGVIGQGVRGSELQAHVSDHANMSEEEFNATVEQRRAKKSRGAVKELAGGAINIAQEAYLKEDDFWKIYGYENEKADLAKALPELPLNELEEMSAERLVNTYPTWSRISEGVKIMRHLPVGPFVSFPAEIIRTAYHTANYAQQELRNPKLRAIGARRTIGMISALSAGKGLEIALRMIAGISADDDDDLRWFVAPWQENSVLLHLGKLPSKVGKSVYRFIDFSFSDPHNTLINPVTALLRGDSVQEGLWEAGKEFAKPFVGEEILHGKIVDIWSNNSGGVPVYNPEDSVNQQAKDITSHLWDAFEPGTITSGRRILKGILGETSVGGRKYNPWVETIAVVSGQRIQELDVAESLKWRARDFNKNSRQSNRILNRVLTRAGHVGEAELRDSYERSDNARRAAFENISGAAKAAVRLGVPFDEVVTTLVTNGVTKMDIESVMAGRYNIRRISNAQLDAMNQANSEEYEERKRILEDLLTETEINQED